MVSPLAILWSCLRLPGTVGLPRLCECAILVVTCSLVVTLSRDLAGVPLRPMATSQSHPNEFVCADGRRSLFRGRGIHYLVAIPRSCPQWFCPTWPDLVLAKAFPLDVVGVVDKVAEILISFVATR